MFSDDPPIELPKIKGLDNYVPAEDFFDDELMERVEKAEAEENKKDDTPTKAGRNIPKEPINVDSLPPTPTQKPTKKQLPKSVKNP